MSEPNEPTHEMPESEETRPASTYEKIMVAAHEAKRLNAEVREGRMSGVEKPTTLAIKRVSDDGVPYRFREGERVNAEPTSTGHEFEASGDDGGS